MSCPLLSALSLFRQALQSPRAFLVSVASTPALPAALLWLLFLGTVSGTTGMYAALQGKTAYGQRWTTELPLVRAIIESIWLCVTSVFWVTLLTWSVARLARATLRFDSLYSTMAASLFPCLLPALLFPLRDFSWQAFQVWKLVNMGALLWTSGLICLNMQICLHARFVRALTCALPALCILGMLAGRALVAAPSSFRAACIWQVQEGKYVRVYTPRDKNPAEVKKIVNGMDDLVRSECKTLAIQPLTFKISLFCFADDELQRKLAGDEEEPDNTAHSFLDCISLSYDTWDNLHIQMAHELCHVLIANRLNDQVHGLIDEGLCEYVAHQAAPEKPPVAPYAATTLHLRTLARPDVFFDWRQARDFDDSGWAHYISAQALVTYLINQGDIEKFKEFYMKFGRIVQSNSPDNDEGSALEEAARIYYKVSLAQLEIAWRMKMPLHLTH